MRLQGQLLNWNDDKGFGFVEPNGGGQRAFVHIKAFNSKSRRPVDGEIIAYELVRDKSNRYKAKNVEFANDAKKPTPRSKAKRSSTFSTSFTLLFCFVLIASVATGSLPLIVAGFYSLMSAITFAVYAIDKSAAQNGRWRTAENTLHMLALIGGWPGAFFAQKKLRHKSSKREFKILFWATVLLNLAALYWLHTNEGVIFLDSLV